MARLAEFNEPTRTRLLNLECPTFKSHPWVTGAPLARRRVAMIRGRFTPAGGQPLYLGFE